MSSDTTTSPSRPGHQPTISSMGSNGSRRLLMLHRPSNVTINSQQSSRYARHSIGGSDRRSNHLPVHQTTSTRRKPSILRRSWRIQQSAPPPPRVVPNTSQAEVFTPTPYPRVDMGVVDAEEPIAMRTRSCRQATPVFPAGQDEPIVRRTRSRIQRQANIVMPAMAAARRYPAVIFQYLVLPVLDKETGKILEYRQLRKDPRYAPIWNPSYANELGRL